MVDPQRKLVSREKTTPVRAIRVADTDYKDIAMLKRFTSEHGKIRTRCVTRLSVQGQCEIVLAVKNVRETAPLSYASTTR